jgi:hypothetical protein
MIARVREMLQERGPLPPIAATQNKELKRECPAAFPSGFFV